MNRLLLALLAALPSPALAQSQPRGAVDATPMTDPELAEARGGFDLPGGITVTLGVTTDTRIDGQEVLRTVFSFDGGLPQLAVLSAVKGEDGLRPVDLDPSGAGVATRDGVVRLRAGDAARVELTGDRLDISHLVGRGAIGSVVANAADNRAIDVTTSVDIGLSGVRPDQLGSAVARVDTLVLDVTTQMVR